MIQLLVMVVCVWSWGLSPPAWAEAVQEEAPPAEPLSEITVPPGIPLTEAFEILKRHHDALMQLPGVTSVGMGADGIILETTNPAVLPTEVEGILIKPVPPPAQESATPSSKVDSERTLPAISQEETGQPPDQQCGPYAHWEPTVGRCKRDAIPPDSPLPPPAHYLLPPPGVIVLHPDGTHGQAESCPARFAESVEGDGWRFCLPPGYSEPIPPLWAPPIAGILYEEALKILERHQAELMQLPGVGATGLGVEGIEVETDNPAILPKEIEGLPIRPRPLRPKKFLSHTTNTRVCPLHGVVALRNVFGDLRKNSDWCSSLVHFQETSWGIDKGSSYGQPK
jgi:hypothetical protein